MVIGFHLLLSLRASLAPVVAVGKDGSDAGGGGGVVLLTPFGTAIEAGQLPSIETAGPLGQYLLFASPEVNIGRDAVSMLIRNQADLSAQWPVLRNVSRDGHTLYIAVKAIDGNSISGLSNVVLLNLR